MPKVLMRTILALLVFTTPVLAAQPGPTKPETTKAAVATEEPGAGVFGLTKLHDFHLTLPTKEFERMQPAGGMRGPGGPGGPGGPPGFGPPVRPVETPPDAHKGNMFTSAFPWARGELTAGGKTYQDVGVRYKGNFTYMASSGGLRRSLKLEFDHFNESQRFQGLKKLNLNSGITDPTRTREVLAFAVFRACEVPTPGTAFAELTLTVPGKYDRENVGLFTLIEQVDKPFLKQHFGSGEGLLLKPEGIRGLEFLGEEWEPYDRRYVLHSSATDKQQRRLIDFARLVQRADDQQFAREIGSYLDVDAFLRFLAANALLANLDSFLAFGHNYYLYLRPDSNQFVFIPWDLDLAFGMWPMGGPPNQQANLSLTHPHPGENKLLDRLLAVEEIHQRYLKLLNELAAGPFSKDRLLKDLAAIEAVLMCEPLAREAKAAQGRKEGAGGFPFGPPGGMFGPSLPLSAFVDKRTQSVVAQLAGKGDGYVPSMGFGPGGPPPPGAFPPGQILPRPLQDGLHLSADQRRQVEKLQAEIDSRIEKILTPEQLKQLKERRE